MKQCTDQVQAFVKSFNMFKDGVSLGLELDKKSKTTIYDPYILNSQACKN